MKLLKWTAFTITTLLVTVVAVIVYISVVIDPNEYKQEISTLAEQQGVAIDISGDLSWQFFPNVAIQIGETELSGITPSIPDARFKEASLALDWGALLRRQIAVRSIYIDGAEIHLDNTQQVNSALAATAAGSTGQRLRPLDEPAQQDTANFSLAIDHIEISNSRIFLRGDDTAENTSPRVLNNFALSGKGINTTGQTFPLQAAFHYSDPAIADDLNLIISTKVSVALASEKIEMRGAEIKLTATGKPALKLHLDAEFDGSADTIDVPSLVIASGGTSANMKLNAKGLNSDLIFDAQISVPSTNLRRLLSDWKFDISTLPDSALTRFSFATKVSGSPQSIILKDLKMTVDEYSSEGEISLRPEAPKVLNIQLSGSTLDLNTYTLNDDSEANKEKTGQRSSQPSGSEALFAPVAAALAWLEGGTSDVALQLDELVYDKIRLQNLHLKSQIQKATMEIIELSTDAFGGTIHSSGNLDLKPAHPQLTFTQLIKNIAVEQVATAFDSEPAMTGSLNFNFQGTSSGITTDELQANLIGTGTLQVTEPNLTTINIERSYCEIAALVEKTTVAEDWPTGTQLGTINANIKMKDNKILLDSYSTTLGNLSLHGNGTVNIQNMTFDILVVTHLSGERTSEKGCVVESSKLRDRDIPIRCKDTFLAAGAKSCRPDGDIVKQLLQSAIVDEIRKKTGMDEQQSEAIEDLLKGLFGR